MRMSSRSPAEGEDLLARWKLEGPDTYARSYGGRVAKLQLKFAVAARDSRDSRDESGPPAAKIPRAEDRRSKYVVVELPGAIFRLHRSGAKGCWMGRRREFRNCQEYPGLPDKTEYTHVCRLCWPRGGEGEDSAGETSPALSGDGEALVIGSSYSSWDIPIEQRGSQDIEGDE